MVQIFNARISLGQKVLCIGSVYIYRIVKLTLIRVHIWLGFAHVESVYDLIYGYVSLSDHIGHLISQNKLLRLKLAEIRKGQVSLTEDTLVHRFLVFPE